MKNNKTKKNVKFGIIVSEFNNNITDRLLEGAVTALSQEGIDKSEVKIIYVPGSFEIPIAAQKLAQSEPVEAIICLGAIIKGETDHYHYISNSTSVALAQLNLKLSIPVTFGILTTNTMKQAFERSGGIDGSNINKKLDTNKLSINKNKGNAGFNAAITAIKMSKLLEALDASNYSKQSQLPI